MEENLSLRQYETIVKKAGIPELTEAFNVLREEVDKDAARRKKLESIVTTQQKFKERLDALKPDDQAGANVLISEMANINISLKVQAAMTNKGYVILEEAWQTFLGICDEVASEKIHELTGKAKIIILDLAEILPDITGAYERLKRLWDDNEEFFNLARGRVPELYLFDGILGSAQALNLLLSAKLGKISPVFRHDTSQANLANWINLSKATRRMKNDEYLRTPVGAAAVLSMIGLFGESPESLSPINQNGKK
jgi:hypothetical protein